MSSILSKIVIVIAGPTAVGKTAAAIEVAKHFNTEIISADSRQCFQELNIGVSRPSRQQLREVPHHFIASHSIHENISAAFFEEYALQKAEELFAQHHIIVMVGGSGLYIRAFCEGLDKIPEIDLLIRERIIVNYQEKGIGWLQQELKEKDLQYHAEGEMQNPQRMMRALEVMDSTGRSVLSFRNQEKAKRNFNTIKIGLNIEKEALRRNIGSRTDKMLIEGLVGEAEELLRFRKLNALQTVGYTEMFEWLDEKISLEAAVALIKTNTWQYAKRQLTWFRKDKNFTWLAPNEIEKIVNLAGQIV